MITLLSIAVDGVAYGVILFIISVGLSITMGLMRVINLAHGGFALLGGAFAHYLTTVVGLGFVPAALLSVLITMLLAWPIEVILYRRIYKMAELRQVLATIGITFMMIASVNFWLGSSLLAIPLPTWLQGSFDLGFRILPAHRVAVICSGLIIIVLLYLLIEKTKFGVQLRAAVDHRDAAASIGIDTGRIFALTFMIGAGLAAFGGILGAELLPIDAYYPLRYMVLFLIVVAVGGMGSISGSFIASISLGILDTAARYLVPDVAAIAFFLVMIILLAIRPNGLMGKVNA